MRPCSRCGQAGKPHTRLHARQTIMPGVRYNPSATLNSWVWPIIILHLATKPYHGHLAGHHQAARPAALHTTPLPELDSRAARPSGAGLSDALLDSSPGLDAQRPSAEEVLATQQDDELSGSDNEGTPRCASGEGGWRLQCCTSPCQCVDGARTTKSPSVVDPGCRHDKSSGGRCGLPACPVRERTAEGAQSMHTPGLAEGWPPEALHGSAGSGSPG